MTAGTVARASRGRVREAIDDRVARTIRLFASVYFAVSLFAFWGLLTLIGVVVDQGKDASFYESAYPPALARLVLRLHCTDIYHSPAYVGIIGLILCSLAVCTFKRVIPARLGPLRPVAIEHVPLHASVVVRGDEQTVRARLETFFRAHGWQIRKREHDGVEWTFADKNNWARRGVLVAHVGFVIIAMGTTLYWARGYSGVFTLPTGETTRVARSGALIRLLGFSDTYDPVRTRHGIVYQPIDYVSRLRVQGRRGPPRDVTLRVNKPVEIDDVLYYQSTYGWTIRLLATRGGRPAVAGSRPALMPGETAPLDAAGRRTATYERFVGTIDATGGIGADPRPTRPGVLLSFGEDGAPVGRVLVPIGRRLDLGDGYAVEAVAPSVFTGIQYRYDPGIPLVGIGAFVLLAGLVISFGLLPARLYVRVDGADRDWTIGLAATTTKGYDIFEEQFAALIDELGADVALPVTA